MPTLLGLYDDGGEVVAQAYADIAAMVNERLAYAGLTGFTQASKLGTWHSADTINNWRTKVETACTHYLKRSVHPAGDLSGLTDYTLYSGSSDFLTDAGIGGVTAFGFRSWTNIPPTGSAADLAAFDHYASTLSAGPNIYSVWFNEIIQACEWLKHAVIQGGWQSSSLLRREGSRTLSSGDPAGCNGAKGTAITNWNASSWGSGVGYFPFSEGSLSHLGRFSATTGSGQWQAYIGNMRGKAQCALALVPSGSPRLFLKMVKPRPTNYAPSGDGAFFNYSLDASLPVSGCGAFGQFGEWTGHGVTVGNTTPSIELPGCDTIAGWATSCPLTTYDTYGFAAERPVVVIEPSFAYRQA